MNKVRIADLKAHLSAHLKRVRRGHEIVVYDRETPIARLVPYPPTPEPLRVRPGKGNFFDVPLPPPASLPFDVLEELWQVRKDRV